MLKRQQGKFLLAEPQPARLVSKATMGLMKCLSNPQSEGRQALIVPRFMYGGLNLPGINGNISLTQYKDNTALDEVYVLSLPAFAWFKADYSAQHPRIHHKCHLVGNRQMLSVGGHDPTNVYNDTTATPDPFAHGLGIFDLSTMQWSDRYDADAKPYVTPEVVKAWYRANGSFPSRWDEPAVQKLFGSMSSSQQSTTDSSDNNTSSSKGSHASSTGAIVGGIVGGLVALAIIVGLLLWWLRRRKRNNGETRFEYSKPELQNSDKYIQAELSAKDRPYEMSGNHYPTEMDAARSVSETNGTSSAAELHGGHVDAELDGRQESYPHTMNTMAGR
ncbi:MAG: hypothetical protein Q9186_003099 [Xanthomendoza sp. 1 TL-2023]